MIKVLLVARDKNHQGGVVSFVEQLMTNFSAEVHATRLVIGRRPGGSMGSQVMSPAKDIANSIAAVRRQRYDVVHINPSMNLRALTRDGLLMAAMSLVGVRDCVVFFHGWDDGFVSKVQANRWARFALKWSLRNARKIMVLGSRFKRDLCALGIDEDKVATFTTMFDGGMFEGIQRTRSDAGIRLLFLSRLVKEKGVYELLRAFLIMRERFRDMRLVIAGDGPEMAAIRGWIAAHDLGAEVTLAGYVLGKEKAQILMDSDLFVFPTYYGEGCPISLLEAMAAGLPIVTTRAGGIPDVFVDGKNGVLLDSVSPDSIVKAVEHLLEKDCRRNAIQSYNRRRAWEEYEAKRVADSVEAIYMTVIEESHRCRA